ncbi:hypothetical protein BC938DRAFT_472044 [Jimgerdemannia flammicorona]|uniref:Uncharacterized protein n=1 Tax=Jimgerdemannia flammicorona TaxID=994334 RepID=A0A433Q6V1_9FUNG|nr:hypothetical protein BC938DRAFT_472044 [Jimgerdemannia flammicorona]
MPHGQGCRGYILLILNQLRLTGDSQHPSEYIHAMLGSHTRWKEFQPTLRWYTQPLILDVATLSIGSSRYRENTLRQTIAVDRWTVGGCKRPSPHFGPNPPVRTPDDTGIVSTYGAALRMMNPIGEVGEDHTSHSDFSPTEEIGIDLGSKYAFCLGFDKKPPPTEHSESTKNNLSPSMGDNSQLSGASIAVSPMTPSPSSSTSTPISNSKTKKKPKKKKKKKTNPSKANLTENDPNDDGDNSDTKSNGSQTSDSDLDDGGDDGDGEDIDEGTLMPGN